MNLQPLYDVKSRLEQAAIAGADLLGEDFRLQRGAEELKPLAAASPVFGKISASLDNLLAAPAEERAGQLLDTLALVDAVVYTQARTGLDGALAPLPAGAGQYHALSYSQLQPLLTALTTTGGGRMEIIQSNWENHPEFFSDFRVLPAVVAGLGDSYGELAELNARIVQEIGPSALPLLKAGFDPAGKKEMARRVEVIAAIEGADATPWLLEALPEAKKDIRAAVILALGGDPENIPLLLDLSKTEKGNNRAAVLQALSKLDGEAVREFWTAELQRDGDSVKFLWKTDTEWAAALIASGLREQLEKMLSGSGTVSSEAYTKFTLWCGVIDKKTGPAMLDFWRWADRHMEEFDRFTNEKDNPLFVGVRLTDTLHDCLCATGPGPLRDFCLTLFDSHPAMTRYLQISFLAAMLSHPAAEVYEKYSPYIQTKKPLMDADRKKTLHIVLLKGLNDVWWYPQEGRCLVYGKQPSAEPLDIRWFERLTRAVWTDVQASAAAVPMVYWETMDGLDKILLKQTDPENEEIKKILIPYVQKRMTEMGQPYTYSRWLFMMKASPRGVLGRSLAKHPDANRIYPVWQLMYEAYQVLGGSETIALLEEVLADGAFQKQAAAHIANAIPWTIEQLRAGKEFPSNLEWSKL